MADVLKIALILTAVDKASGIIDKATKNINKNLKGIEKTKSYLEKYGSIAMVAGGAAVTAFGISLHAAEENEVAVKRLEQVYKSMGQNVEKASKQSQEYASKLEMQIGVEDEAIMAVQAKLATFKKIGDETARMNGYFDRATQLAFDMAATGFGEASGNAVQLGKALNDPVKGITALNRAGIQFTANEKKKIAALVASNKITEAQGLILRTIEKQVGGVAKATVTASAKAKVAWSEVTESLGKAVLPAFTKIAEKLSEIIPKIQVWIEKNGTMVMWIAKGAVALLTLGIAFKAAALGISIYNAYLVVAEAMTINFIYMGMIASVSGGAVLLIIAALAAAAYLIYDNWGAIKVFFIKLWEGIKDVFLFIWKWIKKIFWDYRPEVLIYRNWDKIVAWFKNLWTKVKEVFMQFINYLLSLPGKFFEAGRRFITGVWDGIKSVWFDIVDWVTEKTNWLANKFKQAGVLGGGAVVASHTQNTVVNALQGSNNSASSLPAFNTQLPSYNSNSKSSTAFQFSPMYNLSGTATQADADMINANNQKGFNKMMQQYNNNKQRTDYN